MPKTEFDLQMEGILTVRNWFNEYYKKLHPLEETSESPFPTIKEFLSKLFWNLYHNLD